MTDDKQHKHGDLSYEASATHWHAEVVRLRKNVDILSRNQDVMDDEVARLIRERDEARAELAALESRNEAMRAELESMRETFTSSWCPGGKASIGFESLGRRVVEADRKHPRDVADGMPSQEGAREALDEARAILARRATWMRALECEVAEARFELSFGYLENRLADELLDVATVALRWRRAILERGAE